MDCNIEGTIRSLVCALMPLTYCLFSHTCMSTDYFICCLSYPVYCCYCQSMSFCVGTLQLYPPIVSPTDASFNSSIHPSVCPAIFLIHPLIPSHSSDDSFGLACCGLGCHFPRCLRIYIFCGHTKIVESLCQSAYWSFQLLVNDRCILLFICVSILASMYVSMMHPSISLGLVGPSISWSVCLFISLSL